MMTSLDTRCFMYLKPVSTGVYDWVPIDRTNDLVILREDDVIITDGNQTINSDKGVPNRARFTVHDPNGHLNRKNPMSDYYGSVGLGVRTRIDVLRVDDQFGRTVADTNWGSVGNEDGDTWTAGTSSGGTVAAGDWSVASGTARHSLPVAGSYRLSELSKTSRPFINVEVLTPVTCPTSNVTGTQALATEVWLRTIDVSNFLAVSLAFMPDETLQIAIYDRTAGTNRYLLNYTALSGFSLSTTTNYMLRCHVEGGTVRAKVWEASDPEPLAWQATGSDAVIREGYVSIADYAFSGNTNTFPLVFQHDWVEVSIPVFTGEITNLVPGGEDKTELKTVDVEAAGILSRLVASKSPAQSAMRRARSRHKTWLLVSFPTALSGTTRTFTATTASIVGATTGDLLYFTNGLIRKEDTICTVTGTSVAGANTTLTFTPDVRDSIVVGDIAFIYRKTTAADRPVAYWPMEDGEQATQIASGLEGGAPMSIVNQPDFAAESDFIPSGPVLQLNDAELTGTVPDYTDTGEFSINFFLAMPSSDEAATGSDLVQFYTTGTGYSWDLQYTSNGNGSLRLQVFNAALSSLYDTGSLDFTLRGNRAFITLVCQQVGGTVTQRLGIIDDNGIGVSYGTATVTGVTTLGKITQIRVNPGGGYDNVGFGHLTVVPDDWSYVRTVSEVTGWSNRNVIHRYSRLCYEEDIAFTYRSNWDVVTPSMGIQKSRRIGDLIKEPAEVDDGFLIGARGDLALEYITRGSLVNIDPMITLDVNQGHVKPEFRPTIDYDDVENRVTVDRIDGSTGLAELTTGPLSTQEPTDGIGVRDGGQYQLSLSGDNQVQDHADWRLAKGTLDQYRVPALNITSAGANATTVERLLSLGVGMRVDIQNLTALDIYDTLQQLINGTVLKLGKREYPTLSLVCTPYEVYQTLAFTDDDRSRPDMEDTELGSTLTTTQTGSVTLTSASGYYLVTTLASDFPLNLIIEGEEITFSAVSGDVSPQTGTISARSVNGVVKSHAIGEAVQLYRPNRYQFR